MSSDEDVGFLKVPCETKPAKDVRDNLGVVVNEARYQDKCTIITQHGKAAAAVVPIRMLREAGPGWR
jgi:prevent-host-death family protein